MQNLKVKVYFMQSFMEPDIKKFSDVRTVTIGVWGLNISLGQYGSKAYGNGLIKTLVKNPTSNFHKQDLIFSRIMK